MTCSDILGSYVLRIFFNDTDILPILSKIVTLSINRPLGLCIEYENVIF